MSLTNLNINNIISLESIDIARKEMYNLYGAKDKDSLIDRLLDTYYGKVTLSNISEGDVVFYGNLYWIVMRKSANAVQLLSKNVIGQSIFDVSSNSFGASYLNKCINSIVSATSVSVEHFGYSSLSQISTDKLLNFGDSISTETIKAENGDMTYVNGNNENLKWNKSKTFVGNG